MKLITVIVLLALPIRGFASALLEEDCQKIGMAGASAMSNSGKGVSKEKLKAALPPLGNSETSINSRQHEMLVEMHRALDEAYAYEAINVTAFMVYKAESCFQKINGKTVVPYSEAHPNLKICSSSGEADLIECSMKAAGAKE